MRLLHLCPLQETMMSCWARTLLTAILACKRMLPCSDLLSTWLLKILVSCNYQVV